MKGKHFISVVCAIQILGILGVESFALDIATHRRINEYVAMRTLDDFSLHSYLKKQLEIQQGVENRFRGIIDDKPSSQTVAEWFGLGGTREDSAWYLANTRSRHHYHNPLNDQGFSGIGGTGYLSGESSITWSQRPMQTQSPEGFYSWNDVRGYFYEALTASDRITKERKYAETFRGLGQLMHLVQDLSVPEHARDDGHYLGSIRLATHYEQWVGNTDNVRILPLTGQILVRETPVIPKTFDSSKIGTPSPFAPIAPVPIGKPV
jgi:hypothetical protein